MKFVRLMGRIKPEHKKALKKEAKTRSTKQLKVSESEIIRELLDQRYGV